MSLRAARLSRSCQTSKLVSLAKRISPPGTSDCSGSHCLVVPFADTVLIPARRSAPPMASTARETRLCSRVGPLAQDIRAKAKERRSVRFMGLLPEVTRKSATFRGREGTRRGPENCCGCADAAQAEPHAHRPAGVCRRRHRAHRLGAAPAESAACRGGRLRQLAPLSGVYRQESDAHAARHPREPAARRGRCRRDAGGRRGDHHLATLPRGLWVLAGAAETAPCPPPRTAN